MPESDTGELFADLTAVLEDAAVAAAEGQSPATGPEDIRRLTTLLGQLLSEARTLVARITTTT